MIKKQFILIYALLLIAATLSAWSLTDDYFGNRFGSLNARSQAMGGTGLFEDTRVGGIALNPANITLMEKWVGLEVAGFVNRNEDHRALPLYNSFDNYIDDAVYASSINFNDDFAGTAFGAVKFGSAKLGLGLSYRPILSFDSGYLEQIRNNRNTDNDTYPELVAVNRIENEGKLMQASALASLGFRLGEYADLNLGFEFGKLMGGSTSLKTIRWSQWAVETVGENVLPEYTYDGKVDLDGMLLKSGIAVRLNERFGLAGTWQLKSTLDRAVDYSIHKDAYRGHAAIDSTASFTEDFILPSQFNIGLNYQPRNIMRTRFNLEAEWVRHSEISSHYDDCLNFYTGVEHHVNNRLPLRLGFQAVNSYLRDVEDDGAIIVKKVLTPMITGGSSIPLSDNLHLDLGLGYSWREYEALDLFGDTYYNDKQYTGLGSYKLWPNQHIVLSDRGWDNPDKVRESNVSLSASLGFTW